LFTFSNFYKPLINIFIKFGRSWIIFTKIMIYNLGNWFEVLRQRFYILIICFSRINFKSRFSIFLKWGNNNNRFNFFSCYPLSNCVIEKLYIIVAKSCLSLSTKNCLLLFTGYILNRYYFLKSSRYIGEAFYTTLYSYSPFNNCP